MTAVYYEGAGRFTLGDGELIPPGPGEVRLDVAFCGVCGTDLHIAQGHMDHRVSVPQVIGHEMSGTVAEVGAGVDGYAVGDNVVVRPLDTRGETAADKGVSHICRDLKFLGIDTPGAFQSSWTVPAFTLHRLPPSVDLRRAALVEPLAVACHDVRRGEVAAGNSVVVIGGGPIGLLVGLVARERGASVTVSEVSPFRRELAAELGLEAVDPTAADLTAAILARTGGCGRGCRVRGVRLYGGGGRDDATRMHPRHDRDRRDLPRPAAGATVRLLLEGAADDWRTRLRAGRLRRGDLPPRGRHAPSRPSGDGRGAARAAAVRLRHPGRRRAGHEDPDRLSPVSPSFAGKTVLVTGCRRGIGKAIALAFAAAGADVIGVSATLEEDGGSVGREVEELGVSFRGHTCDFADRAAVYRLVDALKDGPTPDVLVNNAGTIRRSPAVAHRDEDWDAVLEVNLTAQFVLTRELGARMLERRSGKIVFIASLLSFQGGITVPGYAASKGGIAQLTKALANEWAASGVNVNAVAPGYIATDNTQALQDDPGTLRPDPAAHPGRPMGRRSRHRRRGAVPRIHCGRLCSRRGAACRRWMARAMTDRVATTQAVLGHGVVPVVVLEGIDTARPVQRKHQLSTRAFAE